MFPLRRLFFLSKDRHVIIEDLHGGNVLRVALAGECTRIAFVDPVLYLNPYTKLKRFAEEAHVGVDPG